MAVILACPAGHRLKVPRKFMGQRIVCPVCDARIDVPASQQRTSPTPLAEAPTKEQRQVEAPSAKNEVTRTPLPSSKSAQPPPDPVAPQPAPRRHSPVTDTATNDTLNATPRSFPASDPQPNSAAPEDGLARVEPGPEESFDFSEFAINEAAIPQALEVQQSQSHGRFLHTILLSIASVAVALLCLAPSVVEQTMTRHLGIRSPDVWSYIVILLAIIQIGIALFAARVPDWSTVWLMTITATGVSAVYAAGLALTMFADQNHAFVRQLGLLDEAVRHRVQPWCFLVICLGLMLAYFCGRCSVAWHQLEMQRAGS